MAGSLPTAETATQTEADVAFSHAYLGLARTLRKLDPTILALWPVLRDFGLGLAPTHLGRAFAALGDLTALLASRERWPTGSLGDRVSVSAVGEAIDLIVPAVPETATTAAVIEEALAFARNRYDRVLLDLSGLDLVEAHEVSLISAVGIVLFVPRGRISEFALAKLRRRLPADRLLGASLMDAKPHGTLTVA
jgi:hypothetical protein